MEILFNVPLNSKTYCKNHSCQQVESIKLKQENLRRLEVTVNYWFGFMLMQVIHSPEEITKIIQVKVM